MDAKYGLNLLLAPRICPLQHLLEESKAFEPGSGSGQPSRSVLAAALDVVLPWLDFAFRSRAVASHATMFIPDDLVEIFLFPPCSIVLGFFCGLFWFAVFFFFKYSPGSAGLSPVLQTPLIRRGGAVLVLGFAGAHGDSRTRCLQVTIARWGFAVTPDW